jgi:peptidoglycan/LPS O-acetylase OafA/YrhL
VSTPERLQELDVFRGIAALAVVAFHYTTRYGMVYGYAEPPLISFPLGSYRVNLFFMISGFVIFMTLDKTKRGLDFVVARCARLYPAYWTAVVLTATAIATFGLPGREVSIAEVLVNLSMFQEFFSVDHVDGVYWTLQVEMLFYINMLILFTTGMVGALWLTLAAVYWASPLLGFHFPYTINKILILEYIPYFVMGMTFYRWRMNPDFGKQGVILLLATIGVIALSHGLIDTIIALFFCFAFYGFIRGRLKPIVLGPLVFLGTISYSLYLIHQHIGFIVMRSLEDMLGTNLSIGAAFAASIMIASVLTYSVERPSLRFVRSKYATKHS